MFIVRMPQQKHIDTLRSKGYKVDGDQVEVTKIVTDAIIKESPEALKEYLEGMADRQECITYSTRVGVEGGEGPFYSVMLCGKLAGWGLDFLVMSAKAPKKSTW